MPTHDPDASTRGDRSPDTTAGPAPLPPSRTLERDPDCPQRLHGAAGVILARRRADGTRVYLVWGRAVPGWRSALQIRYAIGERVPTARPLLGAFDRLDDARAALDQAPPIPAPHDDR